MVPAFPTDQVRGLKAHGTPVFLALRLVCEALQAALQVFLGGEGVVPGLCDLRHRRSRKMLRPPPLDQRVDAARCVGWRRDACVVSVHVRLLDNSQRDSETASWCVR